MRSSIEISSGGSGTAAGSFERSSTRRNAASSPNRSTSSSGSMSSPAIASTRASGRVHWALAQGLAFVQQLGGGLEALVIEQALHQRVARVDLFPALVRHFFGPRQQLAALDVDERRGGDQELAGEIQIELLHQAEVRQVLLGDERDRDVVDVHLMSS